MSIKCKLGFHEFEQKQEKRHPLKKGTSIIYEEDLWDECAKCGKIKNLCEISQDIKKRNVNKRRNKI